MAVEPIAHFPQHVGAAAIADLNRVFELQRTAFSAEPYPDYSTRVERLKRLDRMLREHEPAIQDAISADFGNRAREETLLFEQFMGHEAVRHTLRHLRAWMKPERRKVPYWSKPGRARVIRQPLGLVGVIVPWNYPLMLAISPAIAALAAGNRVMIKMSEYTPRLGGLLAEIVGKAFREDELYVLNGEVDVATAFASRPFDHLLFTGSTRVGREIMRLASQNLTPVTLELGGKSPAIVHEGLGIEESAHRIMYGKCANSGQTCVAPDYALVPEASVPAFIDACRKAVKSFYPTLAGNPQFTTVAQDRQYQRLQQYIDDARARGATLHPLHDEPSDPVRRVLVPTALTGVKDDMVIMQEEIFGPLLPVVPYRTLDEAIRFINHRPRPLALYYFGTDKAAEREVMQRTISGGVTINNCMFHVAMEDLPFGGVGPSGMGHYHGSEGFETFTKHKAVYIDGRLSGSTLLRPPYGKLFRLVMGFIHR